MLVDFISVTLAGDLGLETIPFMISNWNGCSDITDKQQPLNNALCYGGRVKSTAYSIETERELEKKTA
jgi:hypothetical protein